MFYFVTKQHSLTAVGLPAFEVTFVADRRQVEGESRNMYRDLDLFLNT
jgi:hypothetical protein